MERNRMRQLNSGTLITVMAVALLASFVFILIYASGAFGKRHTTVNTTVVTVEESLSSTGYIFRDESVLTTDLKGPVLYLTEDGDKVATNTELAILYQGSSMPAASLQEQISSLQTRIGFLENALGNGLNLSDISSTKYALEQMLLGIEGDLGNHNLASAMEKKSEFLSYLTRYHTLTQSAESTQTILSQLKNELEQLLAGYSRDGIGIYNSTLYPSEGANPGSFATAHGYEMPDSGIPPESLSYAVGSGYFYRASRVDGYETLFTTQKLSGLTVASFHELLDQSAGKREDLLPEGVSVIGKMVSTPEWKVVIPIDALAVPMSNAYGDFTGWQIEREGLGNLVVYPDMQFRLTFHEMQDEEIVMKLDKVITSNDDGILLVLSTYSMPENFGFSRAQTVKILMNSVSGYHVPRQALTESGGVPGVYVLDGNRVTFKKVTVIYEDDGYVIAETSKKKQDRYELYRAAVNEGMEEDEAEAEYLHPGDKEYRDFLDLNDQIILGESNLYDGKLLG